MKRIQILFLLLIAAVVSQAQQLPITSFYEMQRVIYNPAAAGISKHGSIGATYRKQWTGIPGGPQTASIFGDTYFSKIKMGLGAYIFNDVTGPTKRTGIQTSFAYHIPMRNESYFSLGIQGVFQQYSLDKAKLQTSLGSNDPVLNGKENSFKGDAGFGIAYTSKTFDIGASVTQLIQSKLNYYSGTNTPNEDGRLYRHFYVNADYKWNADGRAVIIPNVLFVYLPNAPMEFQGGVRIVHNDLFWYGLSYRVNQSWMLSAGVKINHRFNIGYSFDMYSTPLSGYDKGANAHEILLRYDFIK